MISSADSSARHPRRCSGFALAAMLGLLIAPGGWLCGQTAAPTLEADRSQTDLQTGETLLRGNAQIRYDNLLLTADELRYNPQTGTASAAGNVTITRGDLRILAEEGTFRHTDEALSLRNFRLGRFPFYASGASLSGTLQLLTLEEVLATYREPSPVSPEFAASSLHYAREGHLQADDVTLFLGPLPLARLPGLATALARPPFETELNVGFRSNLGAFVRSGARLPVGPALRIGANLDAYTNRGVLAGPAADYGWNLGEFQMAGYVRSGYIDDNGPRGTDILGRTIEEDRGFAEWRHQQRYGASGLTGQLYYWSDSEVARDFRPDSFFGLQEPDSFLEAVYADKNLFLSAFARLHPNEFQIVPQRLPELRLDLLPTPLAAGLLHRFSASAARLELEPRPGSPDSLEHRRTARLDAYYSLFRPVNPTDFLTLTPVLGGRVSHYTRPQGGRDSYTRVLGEIGLDAALHAYGTYDYRNPLWQIDGIRHQVVPRLSYRYVPEGGRGRAYIPPIDRRAFSSYLQPLGLGDIRHLDDLHEVNTLRIGLDNIVQTRDPDYGSRDLLRLSLANDLRFAPLPGESDFSALHTHLEFTPMHWLRFDLYQRFDAEEATLRELNTALTLADADVWALRLATLYLQDEIHEYLIDFDLQLNEVYRFLARVRYDADAARFHEQRYGIRQQLHGVWSVDYEISFFEGPRRESSFGFSVSVDVLSF